MKNFQIEFWQHDSPGESFIETSGSWTGGSTEASRSSQEVSHVSRSRLQEIKREKRTIDGYGRKCLELLPKQNPLLSLLKMLLASSQWHSMKCSMIWKPKSTPAQRLLFQLAPSTHRTAETEYGSSESLMATPTATMNQMAPSMMKYPSCRMWATPTTDCQHPLSSRTKRYAQGGTPLQKQVLDGMLPTPTQRDYKDTGENTDYQKIKSKGKLAGSAGGALNPDWVCRMMGFPDQWLDIDGPKIGSKESREPQMEERTG